MVMQTHHRVCEFVSKNWLVCVNGSEPSISCRWSHTHASTSLEAPQRLSICNAPEVFYNRLRINVERPAVVTRHRLDVAVDVNHSAAAQPVLVGIPVIDDVLPSVGRERLEVATRPRKCEQTCQPRH